MSELNVKREQLEELLDEVIEEAREGRSSDEIEGLTKWQALRCSRLSDAFVDCPELDPDWRRLSILMEELAKKGIRTVGEEHPPDWITARMLHIAERLVAMGYRRGWGDRDLLAGVVDD